MGGSYFLLGRDLREASKRTPIVLKAFKELVLPRLEESAIALTSDPLLTEAKKLVDEFGEESLDSLCSKLSAHGEKDQRGYPIRKIVNQLLLRKAKQRNWHQF